jgi:hypothetical protein
LIIKKAIRKQIQSNFFRNKNKSNNSNLVKILSKKTKIGKQMRRIKIRMMDLSNTKRKTCQKIKKLNNIKVK